MFVSIVAVAAISFLSFIFYFRMEAELESIPEIVVFSILYFHQKMCTYTLSAAAATLVTVTTYMFRRHV